ncbi:RNA polymerase Rpb4-domain-containing protein [Collybia nuda]|uniref:DNA-directed RNA polymerase III subunit RPC9 n=1 Tax=Collybia nuda TaxID=64659 RepID=A0A9P6CJB9_9AGAR|nr:RNA polymerase Rpb4-domain-containing protein [Collybia nuda]
MEVVDPRVALLSNFEVLTLLRELESDHLFSTKSALRIKKEEEASGGPTRPPGNHTLFGEASENLRTIEVEAIQYLSADYLPTHSQSPEGITQLVRSLAAYDLTKAEKLQVVNLAPTLPVELYVIVEELEDRLGEGMDEILSHVQTTLASSSASATLDGQTPGAHFMDLISDENGEPWDSLTYPDADEEVIFDDTGEGAGIEGDLDMDDD